MIRSFLLIPFKVPPFAPRRSGRDEGGSSTSSRESTVPQGHNRHSS
jgi:hypothetical protein